MPQSPANIETEGSGTANVDDTESPSAKEESVDPNKKMNIKRNL